MPVSGSPSTHKDTSNETFVLGTLFERQAILHPDSPALSFNGASLTYAELNLRANRLASHLRSLGVGPESLVGIHLDRSFNLIVGILAILKAGGAYLPLDLVCPEERLLFMLEDSGAKVLITHSSLASSFPKYSGKTICLDHLNLAPYSSDNIETPVTPASLAYVIYTSGSTGTPKGVLVTHENVTRLFTSTDAWFDFGPHDVWTLFHSCAFDFSVWEIFGALLYGGRLVVVPYAVSRSVDAFCDLIVQEKVTVLNQTPSAFRQFVQADRRRPKAELALRYIIFGGEALEFQTLAPWFARYGADKPPCVNMYGITETTVHVTYRPITQEDVDSGSVSNIGIPIPDLQVYVVNAKDAQVSIGEVGEMLVGGKGLARGYLNRPDLTKSRFIPNPFDPDTSSLLYRTGDSARRLLDGELEYLGRIDQQVKIRGFRIELSEIESVLSRCDGVGECVVVARTDPAGEPRLVAYLVTEPNTSLTIEALRARLSEKLPEYMVPVAYVFLDSLPLTLNGKLDRSRLPAPGSDRPRLATEFVAPQGELEVSLAKIWRTILRLDAVGINDNFFDLGGDSLTATSMMAQFEKLIGRRIGLRPLLEAGTIVALAAAARKGTPAVPLPIMACTQAGRDRFPLFFAHGDYLLGGFYCQKLAQNLDPAQPFYALAPHGTFGGDLPSTIEQMAASYVGLIRSVQPAGPYHLGGFCNGAVIMYDVAQQLISAGETVSVLVLLDPPDLYFFTLRRRIIQIGKFLGMSEGQGRNVYQRVAEGVQIWNDYGVFRFLREFARRSVQWVIRKIKSPFETQDSSGAPNLNFHYYAALAAYEPEACPGLADVWIILREGERERHSKQISYWSQFVRNPHLEVVSGTHLEFKNSLDEISAALNRALRNVPTRQEAPVSPDGQSIISLQTSPNNSTGGPAPKPA